MPKAKKTHALRFAYSTINWTTKPDLISMFKDIKKAGWQAVELFDHSLDWLGPPDYLRSILGGLRTPIFFGGIEVPSNPDALTIHKRRMDYAAIFGAEQYGIVGGGRLRTRPPTAAEYKNLAQSCEELAHYGAAKGITLAYHPHVGCTIETEGEIDILLNETQKTKLCLDVSHIGLVGEDSVAHLRKYKARLGYVHLKDWAGGKFVEIGKGTIGLDFGAILAELVAQQYPGWVVTEQSSSTISPYESACINAAHIKSLSYSLALPEGT
ncbi:MAG: sugar phosphate isomerase/epimerase [Anaerolineae bacterium]|nr:sugar phosphate isomerase/epimerase [Anaerolineae bacterium]